MPAVLVHGVADTGRIWKRVQSCLSRTDVVTPTLPGFGTELPKGFTPTKESYLDWLIDEIECVGTPVDLVGHDWGCLLTARIASVRPDLVHSWTGISGPLDPDYPWHYLAEIWQKPGEGERWMAELDHDEFTRDLIAAGMPEDEAREAMRHMDDTMKTCILALYRSAIHVGEEWKPGLANMSAPSLVLWGMDDPFLPHPFADALGNATLAHAVVKLRCSHWPLLERAQDVARELEAHWAAADRTGSPSPA